MESIPIRLEKLIYEEMARICKIDNYDIRIYTEPLGNPSFHVIYKDEWEVVLQIKDWKILEVKFGNFKKGEQLPNNIKKDIKNILIQKHDEFDMTRWKVLLIDWNMNNLNYKIDTKTSIPE